jgi:hypothetical protein
MAVRSTPCNTSVLPVHEIVPLRVAPYAKSGAVEASTDHVLPPSYEKSVRFTY